MRQKLHLGLSGLDVPHHHMMVVGANTSGVGPTGAGSGASIGDGVNHAYNSVNNVTASSLSSLR